MPKHMRSRRSIKKQPYNDYNVIGTANNGKIKVLKARPDVKNASVPLYSNKANTVYFIAKEFNGVDTVTSIAVYRGRRVMYNIDLDRTQGEHYHTWDEVSKDGVVKLKRDDKHKTDFNAVKQKLMQMAKDWNNGGN